MSTIAAIGSRHKTRLLVATTLVATTLGIVVAPPSIEPLPPPTVDHAVGECIRPWVAPVDAPVTDPFRPPDHRYGPGNRGLEFGTDPGQDVVAVAAGVVEFSGRVAGQPVVVVAHGGGLRSSYVNLLEGVVVRGQVVDRGQRLAAADAAFHLGARRQSTYVDPAQLIERLCVVVRFVPR